LESSEASSTVRADRSSTSFSRLAMGFDPYDEMCVGEDDDQAASLAA
jgi:hypothetical protein